MNVKEAYQYCQQMAKQHYENFPVASLILPRRIRRAVTVIYAFARTADDLADEGEMTPEQRIEALNAYEQKLAACIKGELVDDPVFIALHDVIGEFQLSTELFYDLLSAFRQDITQTRYDNFGELMDYCRRSANPVGRLLLELYGVATPKNNAYSDGICSALQLINFLQDIRQDYEENNRIYLPQADMQKFNVSELQIKAHLSDAGIKQLLTFQVERARKILKAGAPLGKILPGRLGLEMRLIIYGGTRILYRLHQQEHNYFSRPRLRLIDKIWIVWRAFFPR
ncbi:MAG: squalene synthase HpnC [Gammaproteobacteria bacterium]|nr:squalene synthase HpnC [Gammaproteobacteria bacterium]